MGRSRVVSVVLGWFQVVLFAQKILAAWTGKEMPGLQAASVAVGQLVGVGILTFRLRGR